MGNKTLMVANRDNREDLSVGYEIPRFSDRLPSEIRGYVERISSSDVNNARGRHGFVPETA